MRISTLTCLGDSCHVSSAPLRLISRRCLALAYQFLSRLCLRFACLCNAIATLAGHFEAVARPVFAPPLHLRPVICFATAYLRHTLPWQFDSSQCHRMTHHCNQSLCAVRLHTSTPLHRTLRYATAYHAVPLLLDSERYCAAAVPSFALASLCFASAYHSVLCRCLACPFDTMLSQIIAVLIPCHSSQCSSLPLHCTLSESFAVRLCALP